MAKRKSLRRLYDESNRKTAHFDLYAVKKSDDNVILNIMPGDTGQAAQTDIFLEGVESNKGIIGRIENYNLGTCNSLNGKFLDVYTAITDVSGTSDLTSLEFHLYGGVAPYKYYMEKTVQEQGATIIYKISIFFSNP